MQIQKRRNWGGGGCDKEIECSESRLEPQLERNVGITVVLISQFDK